MIFECPECGQLLNSEEVDFRKHALLHWNVEVNRLDQIRNAEAKRRYSALIEAAEKADLEKYQVEPKIADVKEHISKGVEQ